MTEYSYFKNRILKAECFDEIRDIQRDLSYADLTEDDKLCLGGFIRARYGNHIQFKK